VEKKKKLRIEKYRQTLLGIRELKSVLKKKKKVAVGRICNERVRG